MKKSIIHELDKKNSMDTYEKAPEQASISGYKKHLHVMKAYGGLFLNKFQMVLAHHQRIWALLGLILVGGSAWYTLGVFGFMPIGDLPMTSSGKWQAVFMTNGQVYFGHLANYNRQYAELRNIYYIQSPQGQNAQANMSLVKLGVEIHGPEDVIFIPKDKILFLENLRSDSQVVKTIESAK